MFKKTMIAVALLAVCAAVPVAMAQQGRGAAKAECDGTGPGLGNGPGQGRGGFECRDFHGGRGGHGGHGFRGERGGRGERGMFGFRGGPHLPPDSVLEEWGADEATIAKLHDLEDKYTDKGIDMKADVAKAQEALQRLHRDGDATEAQLHKAIDALFAAKADLRKLHASAALEAKKIMGDDLFEKFHQRRQGRQGRGPRGR